MVAGRPYKLLGAALTVIALTTPSSGAPPLSTDLTPITMTAQDSTDAVWGVGPAGLYQWSRDHWSVVSPATPQTGTATGAWPGPDGGVMIGWQEFGNRNSATVIWRRGDQSKVLGNFDGSLREGRVFSTPPSGVWLTAQSPNLYRLSSDGHFHVVYTFEAGQFFPYRSAPRQGTRYWPFEATPDGEGRIWFWGKSLAPLSNLAPLEGFVVYDGRTFDYHRTIPGLPDHPIVFLGREDGTHLWAGVLGQGLYSIDIDKLSAAPIPEPEPHAFGDATRVFSAGGDTYLISDPAEPPFEPASANGTPEHRYTAVLWRHSKGQWTKVLNGIDDLAERQWDLRRPRLAGPEGFWFGSYGSGLWFIPSDGSAAQLVNWRQGFPLDSANALYDLGGGKLLAVQYRPWGAVAEETASLLKPRTPAAKVEVINPYSGFETDPQFHIWGLLSLRGRALNEWDGEKWIAHPLPGNLSPGLLSGADADAQGRIWLLPGCMQGSIAIYDPRHDDWSSYGTYADALGAQAHSVRFFNAADDGMKPAYGPGGQIVFMGACYGINYFDGKSWQLWNRPNVPGLPYFWDGPAFFDSAGKLAIDVHHQTWELGAEFDWRRARYEPEPGPLIQWFRPMPVSGSPPPRLRT